VLGSARMIRADCAEAVGSPPECWKQVKFRIVEGHDNRAHHDTVTKGGPSVDIRNAWMDMHLDW
jgi:hypothetical protein